MFLFELPPLSLCGFVSVLFSLCVFLPLHIWWGVNLVLRSSAPLFYLCLPFSSPSALPALWCLEWVLMFHPPLCANRCSFEAVCYHFIIVLMSLTCICLSCPNVFCVCTVGMYLCSFRCRCMYWIAGFYYIFLSCVYVFFISCSYP